MEYFWLINSFNLRQQKFLYFLNTGTSLRAGILSYLNSVFAVKAYVR